MTLRSPLNVLTLALCTWLPPAHAADAAPLALSAQQTGQIVAALAAATTDDVGLAALPVVPSRYLTHLTGTTGIHCIEPHQDESYHALGVLVGDKGHRQRHSVYFTLTPRIGEGADKLTLAALLKGRTVTQYAVRTVGPVAPGRPALVGYHARNPKPFCTAPIAKTQS